MDKNELARLIGSNLAYWRKERNMTQDELSESINISKSFLAHVERGEKRISMLTLYKAAQVLRVSTDALFGIGTMDEVRKRNVLRILSEMDSDEIAAVERMLMVCHRLGDAAKP